jgi:predicted lipoprotein with Yx(FWY)xxD motif
MKLHKIATIFAFAGMGLLSGVAQAQAIKSTNGLMTDAQGRTLYIFTKDAPKASNCKGACLSAWPAFVPKAEAKPSGDLGIITREDGVRQWTHKDRPLYYYVGDAKPGDKEGDKQGNVWFVLPFSADGVVAAPATSAAPAKDSGYKY